TGLVGHWKLDEESGTLADSSCYGNDGTAIGGPEYASSGKIGYAMGFDGVDDNVNIGDPASGELDFNATQSFTYSIWVRGTDVDSLAFSKGNSSTGYDIIMGASSTVGQHACRIGDGSTDIIGTQTN